LFDSAEDRDHGRVGYPRDGGQLGEPKVRDPAERPRPGLHILVPEQQAGAGLRQGRQGDQQRTVGRQHDGGHVDNQQRGAPRLGQLHVSAVQLGLGQRVPARLERYATQHNTIIMMTRYDFVFFYLLNLLWISSGNPAAVNRFLGGLRLVFGNSYVTRTLGVGGRRSVTRNPSRTTLDRRATPVPLPYKLIITLTNIMILKLYYYIVVVHCCFHRYRLL